MNDLPVACTLTPGGLKDRRESILRSLRELATSVEPLPDGLSLSLPGTDAALALVLDVLRLERACCRFLRFQLRAEPGEGPLALSVTGPGGTREFLEAELGLATAPYNPANPPAR